MCTSIISIQIGQCGAMLGNKFWDVLTKEHGIDPTGHFQGSHDIQLSKIGVYFSEGATGNYVPRSVFMDLEAGTSAMVTSDIMGRLYRPDNFLCGRGSASNNWAKGYYTDGAELLDPTMDVIRKETENCDHLQGFQMIHSIGGGCGSGFGALLLRHLNDEFPDRIIASFSVYPSPKVSEVVVEPYNAVLTINHMLDNTDETFVLDNEALCNIAERTLKLPSPSLSDLNYISSFSLSGLTTCLRFPGQLNSDLRKLAVNMVPFPRLHFFVPGYAPLHSIKDRAYKALTVSELTQQMLDPQNMMAAANTRTGKFLTATCVFRGRVSTKEVECSLADARSINSRNFVTWIPGNMTRAICDIAAPGQTITSTFLGNTTALQDVIIRIMEQYSAMYKRSAFLHWYEGEGMEKSEFEEAEINVRDLISEYQMYENAADDVGRLDTL